MSVAPAPPQGAGVKIAKDGPAIVVRDLRLELPGEAPNETLAVLGGVSFEVARGELVCIVGATGCGKSTLLNVIGGFERPSSGEVSVDGEPVRGPDRRRVLVFQENGVFPWLTVEQNIGFGLSRTPPDERRRIVAHYTELVRLQGFERFYPRDLSGGMRQRVELARALAASPDVLYLDEPFGALDERTRLELRAVLLRLWEAERKTVLWVTHDLDEAVQLADRVLVLTPRPATIRDVVPVPLARPRDIGSRGYLDARDRILAALAADERVGAAVTTEREGADVIVLGGGPAGAILGAYLARAGVDHLILDKSIHPRPHVGESLLCSTTRVFQEIGVLGAIERAGFVHKGGASWSHFAEDRAYRVAFGAIPSLGVAQTFTWHVDRARFDELLLRHAAALGSRVCEGTSALRVELDAQGRACGVRVRESDGSTRVLPSRIVVDATGRGTLLGGQLRLKEVDPELHQFALHGWFAGVERGPVAAADDIHLHVLPGPRAWAWQIPIREDVTSVGVVVPGSNFVKAGEDPDAFFAAWTARSPVLAERMRGARALNALAREGNYSYGMDRLAGDGWLLIGDAARFVDPLFSPGLSIAAESAREASGAIVAALAADDVRAIRFAGYETLIRSGVDLWRELILLYYRLPRAFLALLDHEETRSELQEILQGQVYGRASSAIVDRLRREIDAIEADPRHPWYGELSPAA
jgi:FADH2 O2-dependent halogenase